MTFCEDCDHVETDSRKQATFRWLCLLHPNKRGVGFTTRDRWDKDSPYLSCARVNGGDCKLFEPARDGQINLPERNTK